MPPPRPHVLLPSLPVLLLEDDLLIAMHAEAILIDCGAIACLAATSVAAAHDLIDRNRFGFAMLDLKLGDGDSSSVALRLRESGVPFIVATGYRADWIDLPGLDRCEIVTKPFGQAEVAAAIARALS